MSLLLGTVKSAPAGAKGFDCDTVLTSETATQFFEQGYVFCARYLSLGTTQAAGDLSASEATDILNAGLALMPVQHVRTAGWSPSDSLGQTDGAHAASNAQAVGFPPGVNVWCDLEGVAQTTDAQAVIDHCTAWYHAVSAAGYVPGLYVGNEAILDGTQLYDLPFQHYWQSCSHVPQVANRGYQLVQTLVTSPVNGIGIDNDLTQTDNEGGQVLWLSVDGLAAM